MPLFLPPALLLLPLSPPPLLLQLSLRLLLFLFLSLPLLLLLLLLVRLLHALEEHPLLPHVLALQTVHRRHRPATSDVVQDQEGYRRLYLLRGCATTATSLGCARCASWRLPTAAPVEEMRAACIGGLDRRPPVRSNSYVLRVRVVVQLGLP